MERETESQRILTLREKLREGLLKGVEGVTHVNVAFDVLSDTEKAGLQRKLGRPGGLPEGALAQVANITCVGSGKGGVGKSSLTVNLASALRAEGKRVGVLDADVWGYSIPRMLGLGGQRPKVSGERKILPLESHGIKVMSIGFFVQENSAVVWRGPMLHKALTQFLEDVAWGELDYLLVDLPPGTGDVSMTLAQLLPLFNRFDHGAFPVVMTELPRVVDTIDIDNDGDTSELLPDYHAFPVINLRPATRQNLVTDVGVSNFPLLDGDRTSLAILVGGVVLPSPGFIPTGISATSDEDGDGRPDLRRLAIAPAYGSLVGGRYAIVAITFDSDDGGAGPDGFTLPEEFSVALWNGQNYPTALSLGTFPDQSQASVAAAQRRVSVSATAGPMYRVRMVGDDRSWDVWSLGAPGAGGLYSHAVTVPAAPINETDLFIGGDILVDAIQTNVNVDDLVGVAGVGLTNAGLVSTAYNRTAVR
mgnify:CR=1 FL=1